MVPKNTAVHLPSPADIDPGHVYSLMELIDIAQRRNPTTRVAWEQARQAAIALAGSEHVVTPFPTNLVPQGFITFNAQEVLPQLTVKYLLLDFGGRAAAVERGGSARSRDRCLLRRVKPYRDGAHLEGAPVREGRGEGSHG
jgi:outer membrane protein TolC